MNIITAEVKNRMQEQLGEDGGEVEEVPIDAVEAAICAVVKGNQDAGKNVGYIFDGYSHKTAADFLKFACKSFGAPNYWLPIDCSHEAIAERWRKKNDDAEVGDDQMDEFKQDKEKAAKEQASIKEAIDAMEGVSIQCMELKPTDQPEESTFAELKSLFCAKIVMVNHDPRLSVDVACSNLAIKFNMLYLSVHQLIRHHIRNNTAFGQRLGANRQHKALTSAFHQMGIDPHDEQQFSAVHFDLHDVMDLIQHTIAERRTNQRFILLEGLCNSGKLDQNDDKLSLRYMDELFLIEKQLAEVTAVVSLTFDKEENTHGDEKQTKYEEFPVSEKPEEGKKVLEGEGSDGEGEGEPEGAAAEDLEGENAKPKFDPKKF